MTLGGFADTLRRLLEVAPLRIALVVERFAPGTGGVENVAWQVAHELRRQGEEVTVVAREFAREAEPADGIACLPVAAPGRRSPFRTLAFSRAAANATRTPTFDVVHGFSRTRHQDLYRAGGGSHEDYLERSHPPLGRAIRRWLPRHRSLIAVERQVFADPGQRIQCASRLVADRLALRHGVARERLLLLPNAVDTERFDAVRQREAGQRLRLALDPAAQRIWLLPASGWRRKGLELALAAIARVGDPGLRLWVAGRDDPGPWRRRAARAGVGDRVRFLGPRTDLEIVYAAVDGLLLPTRYDPFANVTFEAAAAGLAIVTSRANGAAEWLSPAACRVVDRLDGEAIAAELRTLAEPAARQRLGDAARREVAPHHWPGHVAALRAEYARLVAARGAAVRP
jgi:UDP-glucose:(heptosyl)LPS alpha-1,3-glucosyltransferase